MQSLALKIVIAWMVIGGLAFASTALRELVLVPHLGQTRGLMLSGLMLSALVLLVACVSVPWLDTRQPAYLIATGSTWLVLTVTFDLVLGWVGRKPVREMAGAYVFKDGNLWPLVLLVTTVAPYLAGQWRGWV